MSQAPRRHLRLETIDGVTVVSFVDSKIVTEENIQEVGDQLYIVARIGFRFAGVARRQHAGRAAQRRHAQPRIVGQRRQPGGAGAMARLGERVLDEGGMGLLGFPDAERRLRQQLDAQRRQQRAELAQLAGVVGGENEFFHVV